MPRWSSVRFIHQIQLLARAKWARPTALLLALLFLMPIAALAQGSPFDTGFNAIQSLFTGTIAKVASLVAIVIGGRGVPPPVPRSNKGGTRGGARTALC